MRTVQALVLRVDPVARCEPLDHDRGDDDRPDRDVPARAVHRARLLGAGVRRQPEGEAADQGLLLHRVDVRQAGEPGSDQRRPGEARVRPAGQEHRLRPEGRGARAHAQAPAGDRREPARQPAPGRVRGRRARRCRREGDQPQPEGADASGRGGEDQRRRRGLGTRRHGRARPLDCVCDRDRSSSWSRRRS